jgi:hypothetical protein
MSMNDFNLLCHVPYYIFPTSEKEKLLMKMKRMTCENANARNHRMPCLEVVLSL